MSHRLKFLFTGLLVVMTSAIVSYAVSASAPSAFLTAGTTRYAAVSASTTETVDDADGWVDVPGMTKYISIPSGKTADVMIIFCGNANTVGVDQLWTRALIRDAVAAPSVIGLLPADTKLSNQCAFFYKTNVTAGSPAVRIQWSTSGSPGPIMHERSMFVIANIH